MMRRRENYEKQWEKGEGGARVTRKSSRRSFGE